MTKFKFEVGMRVEHSITGEQAVILPWNSDLPNPYHRAYSRNMCTECGTTMDGHVTLQYPGCAPQVANVTFLRVVESGEKDS